MNGDDLSVARAPRQRTLWRCALAVAVVAALAVTGVVFNVGGTRNSYERISRDLGLPWSDATKDSDGDGLFDYIETDGIHARGYGVVRTDPENADTDGDGLTDGLEAGKSATGKSSTQVYASISDPVDSDTDRDGIGDGDEYFLDMDPRRRDTDSDGLPDNLELDFGSDPTLDNPDDDSYSDKEEYDRGSDPLAYDLGHGEAVAAFLVGATTGDWEWGARHIGHMRDEQLQSPEYLAGEIASGFAGIGDIRDIAANLGDLDLFGAVESAIGLAPLVGDTTKTVATLTKFADRGGRAERAVSALVERLPWSKSTKESILRKVFGSALKLPKSLEGGPKDNSVYKGLGYVGITKNFARRKAQHAAAGRSFTPTLIAGASGLSRGEARAIEEACIVEGGMKSNGGVLENQRHSINPSLSYYDEAVAWGESFLKKIGGTCL